MEAFVMGTAAKRAVVAEAPVRFGFRVLGFRAGLWA